MVRKLSAVAVIAAAAALAACSSGSGGVYGSASERAGMGDYDASGQIPCAQ
ncbi:MAG: hypothetical protein M8841_00130 [marine benthic group bacterium]|jgi:hypothetical protein|nr:hypothetical protein [Gemmatimonadota bacterium]MCL7990417.1 hypothetical protein [Gemmatimonadota bacterium]